MEPGQCQPGRLRWLRGQASQSHVDARKTGIKAPRRLFAQALDLVQAAGRSRRAAESGVDLRWTLHHTCSLHLLGTDDAAMGGLYTTTDVSSAGPAEEVHIRLQLQERDFYSLLVFMPAECRHPWSHQGIQARVNRTIDCTERQIDSMTPVSKRYIPRQM